MTFKVEQSGWYRTRDGRLAEVFVRPTGNGDSMVIGFIMLDEGNRFIMRWDFLGRDYDDARHRDIVEYLGRERPKEKKVVRMAPALCRHRDGALYVSTLLFASEHKAKSLSDFVRWLIDTPHAIDVEVPDNG